MREIAVLLITLLVSVFGNFNQQSRSLVVEQFKNVPVAIDSVKLGDTNIKPNANFHASPTWSQELEITARNDSEEPISFIEVEVVIFNMAQKTTEIAAVYTFGKREGSEERIAPNETDVLTFRGETGDPAAPGLIRVRVREVMWNGDASRKWAGGHIMYRDPNNPKRYSPEPRSGARYQFPKGFKRDLKMVKALATLPDQGVNCTHKIQDHVEHECRVCNNIYNPVRQCTTMKYVIGSCPLGGCDILDWPQFQSCYSAQCTLAECYGAHATVKSLGPICNYTPETPILVDILGNGLQLTDRLGGVVFTYSTTPVSTAWTAPGSDDSFLAKDRNGNGVIDDGSELFGNNTPQPASFAPNGFLALAVEDTNGDGKVSGSELDDLLLWNDANHNGVSEAGELFSPASVKLTSLDTRYTSSRRKDQYDNWLRYRANGKMDGRTIQVYDVIFAQ